MGMPGSGLLLSEKDLNDKELNFLSLTTLEFQENVIESCQVAASEDLEGDRQRQEEDEKNKWQQNENEKGEVGLFCCSMENMKRPCLGQFKDDEDEDEDGFRTPPTVKSRIPLLVPQCPPAPRKPKSLPLIAKRKKADRRQVVLLDLSNEIEALFPPALLADLGGKLKKVRKEIGAK